METPTPRTPTRSPTKTSHLPVPLGNLSLDGGTGFYDQFHLSHHHHHTFAGSSRRQLSDFPPEIIALITHHLYYSVIPAPMLHPSPDPHLRLIPPVTPYSPPTFSPTPSEQARAVFLNLSLVDRNWGEEGRKALWRNVVIGMPRAFESILRTIDEYKTGQRQRRQLRREASSSAYYTSGEGEQESSADREARARIRDMDMLDWLPAGDARWASMSGNEWQSGDLDGASQYIVPAHILDPSHSPLLFTKSLSFSRFRTAGLRRSVRQGSQERFVTPHRLLTLLRGTRIGKDMLAYPGAADDLEGSISSINSDDDSDDEEGRPVRGRLESVGFTEFMDSAISKSVLDELLFRGGYLAEYEERPVHHHPHATPMSVSPVPHRYATHLAPPPVSRLPLERRSSGTTFIARRRSPSASRAPRLSSNLEESSGAESSASSTDDESGSRSRRSYRSSAQSSDQYASRAGSERRGSGSTFAAGSVGDTEDRGRERHGRSEYPPGGTSVSGREFRRRNRSVASSTVFSSRSMSVPAQHLQRSHSLGTASERSLSVPAAMRRSRGASEIVQVLEGSKEVKPIRALDLCGCVSFAFIAALTDVVNTYKLGPAGLFVRPAPNVEIETSYSTDEDDEDARTEGGFSAVGTDYSGSRWSTTSAQEDRNEQGAVVATRKLRRIYFPHLRRLGLSSSLLPTPLLTSLVLSFPYLTHLDLSSTLTSPVLLKQLALAGQSGPGGRSMRLLALSLARCRLATGEAIVGLLCGDCPPFTSMTDAYLGEDAEEQSWGSGEVAMDLVDLSLYGDGTYPSPLSGPELRLILTVSPAFTSGRLRTLDLSSTPLTDRFLADHFPVQPQLIELGLSNCRGITIKGVATLLLDKTPGVEVLTLSGSCPPPPTPALMFPTSGGRRTTTTTGPNLSVMELHIALLGRVASINPSSGDPIQASRDLEGRRTNLRVVELDDKTLGAVQGGAGDWKVIWGKGRRGWYVDTATTSIPNPQALNGYGTPRVLAHLPRNDPRRQALLRCVTSNGVVSGETGWHARKMEVMRGDGMMGREEGLFAFHAYQV